MAYGLERMVRRFLLYAIGYQPYANHVRLASEIFLSNLQKKGSALNAVVPKRNLRC
jgi:hypothetical protein